MKELKYSIAKGFTEVVEQKCPKCGKELKDRYEVTAHLKNFHKIHILNLNK